MAKIKNTNANAAQLWQLRHVPAVAAKFSYALFGGAKKISADGTNVLLAI
jgi:hypothetical protein